MKAKRRALETLAAVTLAVGAFALVEGIRHSPDARSDDNVVHAESLPVADFSDTRVLVGFADNVFLGTVVGERSTTPSRPLPETQFDVRVLHTIKGTLSGTVVVNQQGGVNDTGVTVLVDGDEPLEPGQTYMFATRTNADTGWHTLVPGYGDVPVDSAFAQAAIIEAFTEAHADEVPPPIHD